MSDEDRGPFSFANWSGAATGGVSRQSYKQKVAQVMIGRTRASIVTAMSTFRKKIASNPV
ncbi:MAG: hypothetical protein OEY05_17050 [Paracoccaceae bacterium]|nr:hypothetical protein [Paracoccaceae bacterium]